MSFYPLHFGSFYYELFIGGITSAIVIPVSICTILIVKSQNYSVIKSVNPRQIMPLKGCITFESNFRTYKMGYRH